MRAILTAMSLTGALCVLSAVMPAGVALGDTPTDQDHTHAAVSATSPAAMMQQMQAMHEKMMSTKTPGERQALMGDRMKLMQQGMAMMQQMNSGSAKGGMSSPMMQQRMDMMTMMMQMMMD